MPRQSRLVIPGLPHHITQRGNRRQNVFFNDDDRSYYLSILLTFTKRYQIDVLGYCLMTNHVHLALVPNLKGSLDRLFKACHAKYAHRINKRHGWNGHLWQERFYSSPVDEEHLISVISYVELNPVRAGMCKRAEEYKWSSARSRVLGEFNPLLSYNSKWQEKIPTGNEWSKTLLSFDDEGSDKLRMRFARNLPCGTPAFIDHLESQHNRSFKIAKLGRPFSKPRNNSDCPH